MAISGSNSMTVTIDANPYALIGVAIDFINVSTTPGGSSGVLTLSAAVSAADATAGNTVTAATGSAMVRPNSRGT